MYMLFLLNWYFLFRNELYIRLSDECFETNIAMTQKAITALILYIFLKNLARVGFLSKILETDTIVLWLN